MFYQLKEPLTTSCCGLPENLYSFQGTNYFMLHDLPEKLASIQLKEPNISWYMYVASHEKL
jgi:hypothetical protein